MPTCDRSAGGGGRGDGRRVRVWVGDEGGHHVTCPLNHVQQDVQQLVELLHLQGERQWRRS